MKCPYCHSEHVIELYPALSEQMISSLRDHGYNQKEIDGIADLWEQRMYATAGQCLDCQLDWQYEVPSHTGEEHYQQAV